MGMLKYNLFTLVNAFPSQGVFKDIVTAADGRTTARYHGLKGLGTLLVYRFPHNPDTITIFKADELWPVFNGITRDGRIYLCNDIADRNTIADQRSGDLAWVASEQQYYYWNGSAWVLRTIAELEAGAVPVPAEITRPLTTPSNTLVLSANDLKAEIINVQHGSNTGNLVGFNTGTNPIPDWKEIRIQPLQTSSLKLTVVSSPAFVLATATLELDAVNGDWLSMEWNPRKNRWQQKDAMNY